MARLGCYVSTVWPRMGRRGVDSTPVYARRTETKYRQRKAEIPRGAGDDMQRKFIVSGKKPAVSQHANRFVNALDLGISGAYRDFADVVTMTLTDEATDEQLAQQPGALKSSYEKLGCIGVQVVEVES